MAVNYVKGQILSSVLERDGIDISIANANVGINTNSPAQRLDVNGNVLANNIFSNVTVSAVGNVIGGNVVAVNNVSGSTANISGNIVVGNLSTTGNVAAGNVLTDNLLYANGVPWDLQQPAGSNTEIQFNNNSNFGANVNFTFDTAANLLTVNATANIANLNVSGNVVGGNILTGGAVSATGDITTSGNMYATNFFGNISGNIIAPGNNTEVVFNDNGTANAVPGFTFDKTSNSVSVSGNITSANILTGGQVSATGDVSGNNFYGSGVVSTTGNITGGNLQTGGVVTATGNIAGGNVLTSGVVSATANVTGGNLVTSGAITATGNISSSANIVGANISTGGQVSATGAVTAGGFTTVGNVTAGNVLFGSGTVSGTGNIYGGNIFGNIFATVGNIANLRIANTTITTDSTISNIVLEPTSVGLAVINTFTGLVVPVGNTAQRPSPASTGTIRFNTQTLRVEVYDGTEWDTIVGGVTNQILNGDGSTTTFTLDRSTTTAAALIMLNGITQIPGQSYNMSPNPSTNLVFTEAPAPSDTIDIRFL
jgi:hypothetical protein